MQEAPNFSRREIPGQAARPPFPKDASFPQVFPHMRTPRLLHIGGSHAPSPYPRGKKGVFLTIHRSTMTTIYPQLKSYEDIQCMAMTHGEGDFNTSNIELDKIRKSSILLPRDGIDSLSFWRSKWQTLNQQRRQFAVLTANGCGIAMSRERCAALSNRCGMRLLRVMLSRRRRSCRARRGNWIRPPRKRSFIRTKLHGSSPG